MMMIFFHFAFELSKMAQEIWTKVHFGLDFSRAIRRLITNFHANEIDRSKKRFN